MAKTKVRLIGLPTDRNSSFLRGPAKAPPVIRRALNSEASNSTSENGIEIGDDVQLEDLGDIDLKEDAADDQLIYQATLAALHDGSKPLFLGGDHSVSFPIVKAITHVLGSISILHIDAHPDLYDDFRGNPRSHASPFARIMELGKVNRLVQVGIRTANAHQREQANRFGVEMFEMKDFTVEDIPVLEGPVYISIDLDGMDPSVTPGVSHIEPGGLSVRQVLGVLQKQSAEIIGADVVELNPDRDVNDLSAHVAAKMVRELAGLMA